mgnify:CR=1 FL=1
MFTIRCPLARIPGVRRKRGRVVEGNSLENCRTRKGIRGSNPLASARIEERNWNPENRDFIWYDYDARGETSCIEGMCLQCSFRCALISMVILKIIRMASARIGVPRVWTMKPPANMLR